MNSAVCCVVILTLASLCHGSPVVPTRPTGLVYKGGKISAPVHIDMLMHPICTESGLAYPEITSMAETLGVDKVRLVITQWGTPYYTHAHLAAQSVAVVANFTKGTDKVWAYLQDLIDNAADFKNGATFEKSAEDVVALLGGISKDHGVTAAEMTANIGNAFSGAKTEWKLGCTRGGAGTPWFFINGVHITASHTWSAANWTTVVNHFIDQDLKINEFYTLS